jgi:hypothetical protein
MKNRFLSAPEKSLFQDALGSVTEKSLFQLASKKQFFRFPKYRFVRTP